MTLWRGVRVVLVMSLCHVLFAQVQEPPCKNMGDTDTIRSVKRVCSGNCGCTNSGQLTSGTITDGDGFYPNNALCNFLIVSNVVLTLKFDRFHTETSIDEVYVGVCNNIACDSRQEYARLSGAPNKDRYYHTSREYPHFEIVFTSNSNWVLEGFVADWTSGNTVYKCAPPPTTTPPAPPTSVVQVEEPQCKNTSYTDEIWSVKRFCSGSCGCTNSQRLSTGLISHGAGNYPNNALCNWLIVSNVVVTLKFEMFDTESLLDVVYVGGCSNIACESRQEYARMSGSSTSNSNAVFHTSKEYPHFEVIFTSDFSWTYPGFKARWTSDSRVYECPLPPTPRPRPNSGCEANEWRTAIGQSCNACPFFSTSPAGNDMFTQCQCDSGKDLAALVDTNMTCSGGCGCTSSTSVLDGQIVDGPRPLHKNCDWLVSSNAVIYLQFVSVDTDQDYQNIHVRACTTPSCVTNVLYATISGTHGTDVRSTVFQTDTAHPFLKVEFRSNSWGNRDGFEAHWWTSGDTDAYACYEEPPALPAPPSPAPPGSVCPAGTYNFILYTDGWLGQYYEYEHDMSNVNYLKFGDLTPFHVTTSPTIHYHERSKWPWENGVVWGSRNNWGARWTGFVHIVTADVYTFELESDDGSWMWLNGALLVDHGGEHHMDKKTSEINLNAGYHSVRFHYFNSWGGAGMIVRYFGGGHEWDLLPGVTIHSGVCTACSPGYYKAGHGDTPCLPCPKGRYSATNSSYVCAFCPAGKVAINVGSVSCTDCGEGSHSIVISGIWGEFCRCNSGFSKTPAGPCARCVAGKYKTLAGDGACSDCVSDTYSQGLGAMSNRTCTSCPHTTTSVAGSVTCRCQAGYTGSDGTVSCAACGPGKFKGDIGSASCTNCPHLSSSNTTAALSTSVCVCIAGSARRSTGTCTLCEPGKYRHASSGPACIACETGTYSPDHGATSQASCVPCPLNMVSPAGSGLLTDCSCQAGYWGWDATYPLCHVCAQGKYKDFVGEAMWCNSCPENKHTLLRASATPLKCTCNPGYTGPPGLDECAPCSSAAMAGLVPTALSQCALCAPGYYTGSGAHLFQRCASCQPDYQRVYAETNVCTQCPGCTLIVGSCPANHWRSFEQSTCEPCPGVYVAPAGSTAETDCTYDRNIWCPANQWQAFAETEQRTRLFERCGPCPPYSSAPKGTKFISACACDNKVDVAAGVIASVTCSGGCECTGSSSAVQGYITDGPGDQSVKSNCKWLFASNAKIHLKFLTFHHPGDFITINLCMTALCDKDRQLIIATDFMRSHLGLSTFETTTDYPFLQVIFTSGSRTGVGFRAEWFTSGPAYSCMQCGMGQYSAVNASTRQDECVSCVAGKYSQVTGGATSAVCTSCPSGMYSSTVGATVCRSCAPGQRSRTDRMGCVMLHAPPACSEAVNASVSCAQNGCECIPTSNTSSGFVSDGPLWAQPGDCSWTISAQVAPSVISVRFPQFWIDLANENVKLYECSDAKCTSRQRIVSVYGMREPMHLKSILAPDPMPDHTDVVYTSTTGHLQVVARLLYTGMYPGFVAAWSARMPECNCAAGFTGACTPCGQGTYKTGTGNAACTSCVAGKNSLQEAATSPLVCNCDAGSTGNSGLAACTLCEPGKYKARNGSAPCTDCPAGSHSTGTGDIWGQACACNAGFSGRHPAACVRCVAGKYKSWVGFGSCTNCSADTYSEEVGAASHYTCVQCPLNSISPAGSGSSFACSCIPGYTGVQSPSACVACAHGKFKSEHGPMACQDCPLDTFSSARAAATNAQCFCNAGFSGPPAGPCAQCGQGKYKSAMGSVSCALCTASTYSENVGATSLQVCGACAENQYSPQGSYHRSHCVCNAGYTGDLVCEECSRGTYKNYAGLSSSCTSCPSGKFHNWRGAQTFMHCLCERGSEGDPGLGPCTDCTPGKYATIEAPNQCIDCPPCFHSPWHASHTCIFCVQGKRCSVEKAVRVCECQPGSTGPHGIDQCSTCARGTYKVGAGSAACDECGTDRNTAVTGATSIAFCECNPGSTGADGSNKTCTLCSPGYFKNVSGPAICTACTRDTYSASAGAVQCTACNTGKTTLLAAATNEAFCLCRAGTTGADGAAACAQCSPGKHKAVHGSADCSACGESTYSAGFGNVRCTGCVLGKSSTARGAATDADCTCDPGTTGANGAETCSQCAPGTHKAVSGNATCENCAHSKYAASPGAVHCTSCPGGKSSTTDGATSHAECICDAGSTGADGGAACSPCNQGRYKAAKGSADCTQCVLGKSTLSAGASSDSACTCDAGSTGRDGLSVCVLCAAGTYKAESGPHNCTKCDDNQDTQPGAIACVCNAGHTAHGPACSACVAGKYKQGAGSHACTPCAAGKHSAAVGASENPCTECAAGSYSAHGSSHCEPCRNNTNSLPGSADAADCVCNAGHEAASCSACVAGKYKQGTGSLACTLCAAGQHAAALGAAANPCAECAAGSYSVDDRSHCALCRNHSHSSPGSASVADCVCNAGYETALCSACVAGKYKSQPGSGACVACAPGKFTASVGARADICTNCHAGSYASGDNSRCVPCPPYSFSAERSVDVAKCACNAGWTGRNGQCVGCAAGKYKLNPGRWACIACGAGKAMATPNSSKYLCVDCKAGSYASTDKTQCVPCRADSHSVAEQDDPSHCLCNAGWSDANGKCVGCVAGKYKIHRGPLACTDCAAGKYLGSVNASSDGCTDCHKGSFSAPDKSLCVKCPPHSSSPAGSDASSACVCTPGRSGATCESCAAGKHTTLGAPCQDCDPGKFSPAPDSASCEACPPGSSNALPASTTCTCEPGFTGTPCASCPADSYKSESGAHACTSCPAASFVVFPDNTLLSDCMCRAGKYLREIPD